MVQIPAAHMSGDVSLAACDDIYHKLSLREPPLKLLYVTPEKISNSPKFQAMLDTLYARGKIARYVLRVKTLLTLVDIWSSFTFSVKRKVTNVFSYYYSGV